MENNIKRSPECAAIEQSVTVRPVGVRHPDRRLHLGTEAMLLLDSVAWSVTLSLAAVDRVSFVL